MTITCKNCNQHFKGHFCNNCGQTADTHKINFHFLWHDIQHGLFHFDNGFFYTAKQLFTRPGIAIREFIDGKRVRHFKPISLVILLATVYGLLYHTFHIGFTDLVQVTGSGDDKINVEKINEWMSTHYAWASLLTLPFYALGTFLVFKKQGYNFVEHLVLNAFLAGQRLILRITTFPIIYAFSGTPTIKTVTEFITLIDFILMVWGYSQFFNKLSKQKSFLLTLLSYLIFALTLIIVGGLIGSGIYYFWTRH